MAYLAVTFVGSVFLMILCLVAPRMWRFAFKTGKYMKIAYSIAPAVWGFAVKTARTAKHERDAPNNNNNNNATEGYDPEKNQHAVGRMASKGRNGSRTKR